MDKLDDKLANIDKLEIGEVYSYKSLCELLNWKMYQSISSNGAKSQIKILESYYRIQKTFIGKATAFLILEKRSEPLPIQTVGRMKQNLNLQFENEQTYELAKKLIENLLKEEGIEFKVIVAKGRNR